MHITNSIMSLVEEKEKHKKNFNRCLNALICPQCGENLKSKDTGGENVIEIEYNCTNEDCKFTYPRIEA